MKNTDPKLEKDKLKSLYIDVIRGFSVSHTEEFGSLYVKHLDMVSSSDIDERQSAFFEKAKGQGVPTREDQLEYLDKEGLWTSAEEEKLRDQQSIVAGLRQSKSRVFLQREIEYFRKEIEKEEEVLEDLFKQKEEFMGYTAESYSSKKINEFYIYTALYKNKDLEERYFTQEEFDYIDFEKLGTLIKAYNDATRYFNASNLKRVSLSPFFLNYFYLCDDNPQIFYGLPVVKLSYHQVELFGYARHFKHLMSELKAKPPEEFYDDPDKLIEFVEAGKNAEKMLEKAEKNAKDHGAMSVVGATKEDLRRMGLTQQSNDEVSGVSLSKEASKKQGSLTMEDMIKLHEGK